MNIGYQFEPKDRLLHIAVVAPTFAQDFQEVAPAMISAISDCSDILLLIEVKEVRSTDRTDDQDLEFFLLNQIKNDVARLAIACPVA